MSIRPRSVTARMQVEIYCFYYVLATMEQGQFDERRLRGKMIGICLDYDPTTAAPKN